MSLMKTHGHNRDTRGGANAGRSAQERDSRKQALTHRPIELAIIGGGAAGMFAAAAAAERNISCIVIERKARRP